jgi:D-alanine-D-alanine ligase
MTCAEEILHDGTSWARIRVALIFGGWGDDYDASCASAAAILAGLDPAVYDVRALHLSQCGQWVVGDEAVTEVVAGLGAAALISALPAKPGKTFAASFREAANLLRDVDVAFPAMHGTYGADGTLQSVLDGLKVPYVGSGVFASAAGMNKVLTKRLVATQGVSVPESVVLRPGQDTVTRVNRTRLGLPVLVKPAQSRPGVGVTTVRSWTELPAAVTDARRHDGVVLVEESVAGREVSLAVIEHPDGRLEIGPPFAIAAGLDSRVLDRLQTLAFTTFRALSCSGLLQLNFRIHPGMEPVLSEVCTLPVLTPEATFPRIWQAAGVDFPELLSLLIGTATAARARASRTGRRRVRPTVTPLATAQ